MKKSLLLTSILSLSIVSCNNQPSSEQTSNIDNSASEVVSESVSDSSNVEENKTNIYKEDYSSCVELSKLEANNAAEYFDEEYMTATVTSETVKNLKLYKNNIECPLGTEVTEKDDVKYIFYTDDEARFVSLPDGYTISVPTDTTLVTDFSLGKYRSKLYNDISTITISKETSNPYNSWATYRDEWLLEYLENDEWYKDNNLELIQRKWEDLTVLKNHYVTQYSIEIKNPGKISKMFYNIAVIRQKATVKEFTLIVMKSIENRDKDFDNMVKSYLDVFSFGTANNSTMYNMAANDNPAWTEETKNYYHKLKEQNYTDWGFYSGNVDKMGNSKYEEYQSQDRYEAAFDYNFEILSSYMHIGWGEQQKAQFPTKNAKTFCGGNGFNGKKVLQFTYQYTINNNNTEANSTDLKSPMFDILRGYNGDSYDFTSFQNSSYFAFKTLAKAIVEYEQPVLFRLNNEMNSDWTSYCGMLNMLDPDLFAASWRVLYDIFDEIGATANTIWIFNPNSISCPYSSWGEDMCYFPGEEYVHVLGLTHYVMNNSNEAVGNTFNSTYESLYKKNKDIWNNYPEIISEFACGAGGKSTGELFRNEESQIEWVKGLFDELSNRDSEYAQKIKGAVWFSRDDGDSVVINALEILLDGKHQGVVDAFKEGFAKITASKTN